MGDLDLVSRLLLDSSGFQAGVDKARGSGANLKSDLTGAFNAIGISGVASFLTIGGALTAFVGYTVDATRKTMEYAGEVRMLSRDLGVSAEEASKLIQIGDDFNISTDAMKSALIMAVRNGFEPTIENLRLLSDEYRAHNDPVERAATLTALFGRNWTVLTPILEAGGNAIDDAAQAAEDYGLVLSEKDVAAARKLEIEQDNLNDQWVAMRTQVGNFVIPILSEAASALNTLTTATKKINNVLEDHEKDVLNTAKSYEEYAAEMMRATLIAQGNSRANTDILVQRAKERGEIGLLAEKYGYLTEKEYIHALVAKSAADAAAKLAEEQGNLGDKTEEVVPSIEEEAEALKNLQAAALDAGNEFANFAQAELNYINEREGHVARIKELEEELKTAKGSERDAILSAIDAEKAALADLEQAHHEKIGWMIADMLTLQLTMDGNFTEEDLAAYLDWLVKWGNMTREEADEIIAKWKEVLDAKNAANAGPGPTPIVLPWNWTPTSQHAAGGKVNPGWNVLGERGWELVGPDLTVYPHEQSERMMAKGLKNISGMAIGGSLGGWEPPGTSWLHGSSAPPVPNIGGSSAPPVPNIEGGIYESNVTSEGGGAVAAAAASRVSSAASEIGGAASEIASSSLQTVLAQQSTLAATEMLTEEVRGLRRDMVDHNQTLISEVQKLLA